MKKKKETLIDFLKVVFEELLDDTGTLVDSQHIRIWRSRGGDLFFNSIKVLEQYIKKPKRDHFFQLATNNGKGGKEEDLISRTVLCFDFDKKDMPTGYNHIDVLNAFKSINLRFHIMIDSGYGYHAYTCINATRDLSKVDEVQKCLIEKLGADANAGKKTQIMRLPDSFNAKQAGSLKKAKIVFVDTHIKRQDLDVLYNRYCTGAPSQKAIKHVLKTKHLPPCLQEMIESGTPNGERNQTLVQLVVTLRRSGLTEEAILKVAEEWADKSGYDDNLRYRVSYIYNNQHHISYDCGGCGNSSNCFDYTEPDIMDFDSEDESIKLKMHETLTQSLRKPLRKDARTLTGNEILVIGVLKAHVDGLFLNELKKEMTYQDKCVLSENTLRVTLRGLSSKNIVDCKTIEGRKFYLYINHPGESIELAYYVSYAAIDKAITKDISTEELRLYILMRHLQHKSQREDKQALKGSLFCRRQKDLADAVGVDQSRISRMINNLVAARMLKIWYRNPSKRNGFDYYTYRLMY